MKLAVYHLANAAITFCLYIIADVDTQPGYVFPVDDLLNH